MSERILKYKIELLMIFIAIMGILVGMIIGFAIRDSQNSDTNDTRIVYRDRNRNDNEKEEDIEIEESSKTFQQVLNASGAGKNTTERFNLAGDSAKITFSFNNNQSCYGDYCSPTNSLLKIYCGNDDFGDLVLNDILSELNKTFLVNRKRGECYLEVDLDESASWTIVVEDNK